MEASETLSAVLGESVGTDLVINQVAEALTRRIVRAIKSKKKYEAHRKRCVDVDPTLDDGTFRVIILIPNFPEGAVTDVSVQVSTASH